MLKFFQKDLNLQYSNPPKPVPKPIHRTPPFAHNQALDNLEDLFAKDIPPTKPNVWDKILQDCIYQESDGENILPDNGTATQTGTDWLEELDNISLVALLDELGNLNMSTYGLLAEEILDAKNIIEAVVEAHTFLEDEDIDKLSSFDLYVRYKPSCPRRL
ncbi:hypothetical protein RhiTH_006966 [Rhizoctonia solani]